MKNKKLLRIVSFAYALLITGSIYASTLTKKNETNTKESNNTTISMVENTNDYEAQITTENNIPSNNEPIFYNTNYYASLLSDSNVYSYDYNTVLRTLGENELVLSISSDGNYDYIVDENGNYGYIKSDLLHPFIDEYFVEVDLGDQTIDCYNGTENVLSSYVTTGKDSSPTPEGLYSINSNKTEDTYLIGKDYKSYVDYWMPFINNSYGLHDASWRSEFGGSFYHDSGSHGCVNLPFDTAKSIYENSSVGTPVLIHK